MPKQQTHLERASCLRWAGRGDRSCLVAQDLGCVCPEHLSGHTPSACVAVCARSESSVCRYGAQMGRQTQHVTVFGGPTVTLPKPTSRCSLEHPSVHIFFIPEAGFPSILHQCVQINTPTGVALARGHSSQTLLFPPRYGFESPEPGGFSLSSPMWKRKSS